jgi:predicted permease
LRRRKSAAIGGGLADETCERLARELLTQRYQHWAAAHRCDETGTVKTVTNGRVIASRARIGPNPSETTKEADRMEVADLVLPVFAVIVSGWLAGWLGYISRSLADGLVHFAYNVAMPALLMTTIAQEPAGNLLQWRFLMAFGGGSLLCFALVFLTVRIAWGCDLAGSTIQGMTAAMTNTGFVALPILHSLYGQPAVLPAAIATVFVAAVMFPLSVILLESKGRSRYPSSTQPVHLARQIALNPMVLSTLAGLAWAIAGWPIPAPVAAYLNILAAALTPCALFAIGLGLSVEGMRAKLAASIALTIVKLVVMPLVVYGLCVASGLNPLYTIAAVVCAAVPTAKTVYILASEYKVEEELVTATVSITTLLSVVTLLGWLYALSGLSAQVQRTTQVEVHPGRVLTGVEAANPSLPPSAPMLRRADGVDRAATHSWAAKDLV